MRTLLKALTTSLLFIFLVSCSNDLSRPIASDLLKASEEFKKPEELVLKTGGIAYAGSDLTMERIAQDLGYLEVEKVYGYYTWIVSFTAKSSNAVHDLGWIVGPPKSGYTFGIEIPEPFFRTLTIPVGSKELVEVTGIVMDGKKATADYTWRVKYNDVGKSFGLKSKDEKGNRSFTLYDDGWRLD